MYTRPFQVVFAIPYFAVKNEVSVYFALLVATAHMTEQSEIPARIPPAVAELGVQHCLWYSCGLVSSCYVVVDSNDLLGNGVPIELLLRYLPAIFPHLATQRFVLCHAKQA